MARSLHLTKTKFLSGLRCDKKLWLDVHNPLPFDAPDPGSAMDVGIKVGRGAHNLFPGGVEVDNPPWDHDGAVAQTRALMADPSVPAIFEAAFEHDGIRIRVDILERLGSKTWGIREVKSSTSVKAASLHLEDVAVQLHVLKGAGLKVTSAELVHINTSYVRGHGGIDWRGLLARSDITQQAHGALSDIAPEVVRQHTILRRRSSPKVTPEKGRCLNPYACDRWETCTADKPDDWVARLYRVSPAQQAKFENDGIESVSDIPDGYSLNANQAIMRYVVISGVPHVSPDLKHALRNYGPPAFYLDFETVAPAIPLYEGTSPYQQVPFQWSIHHASRTGKVRHWEFLAAGGDDPRRPLAEALLAALESSVAPVLAYNAGFEKRVIGDLAHEFPDLASRLDAINARMLDLLIVTRGYTYFPKYNFSFSLKTVAPALAPEIDYKGLDGVAGGQDASNLFARLAEGGVRDDENEKNLRQGLLDYCRLDTLALVEVHKRLIELSRS